MVDEAPIATELQANPIVQTAFAAAWSDSFPETHKLRHEEGGFIYFHPTAGDVLIRRVPPGGRRSLKLNDPPLVPDHYLVATYHTHPVLIVDGGDPDPSPDDIEFAYDSGVPWTIIAETGITYVGPERRVGGLTGPEGSPS